MTTLDLSRRKFLIAHGVDPKRWAARHGLQPFSCVCDCGAELTTSLPFTCGTLRGLIAPECECGSQSRPYCVILPERVGGGR